LASGKAVVASPLAAEGLATRDSDHLIVAESDDGFAESVLRLLADMEFRVALARRARAWAEKNLGWEKTIAAYEALYADLLARMPAVNRG
jgi:glycosyltransferase involved in cell wall biosynthesis